jgi:LPS-assembly protein
LRHLNLLRKHSETAKNLFTIIAETCLLCFSGAAFSETMTLELRKVPETIQPEPSEEAVVIEADKLDLHLDRKMHATGNAVLSKGNQKIRGDEIEYDTQNDELKVNGNASIETGNAELKGPSLKMQLSESIGEMRDASITLNHEDPGATTQTRNDPSVYTQSKLLNTQTILTDNPKQYVDSYRNAPRPIGQSSAEPIFNTSRGDAKAIFFEGQDKKRLENARYTTCEAGVDDWYIKAKEIELNDYTQSGTAKNAYVEFKGIPILYTPWIDFSFNNERQSGLLDPTIGTTSRSGFETAIPYYINIAPDKDATVGVRYLSKRGTQLQGEFRYLSENYSGIDAVEYLGGDNLTNKNRYYANLQHSHSFGNGWSASYDLEKVSDNAYFSDLSTRIITTSQVNLPQQGRVDYTGEVWKFNGLVQKYQTLDGISYPYQRLPQLTLTADKEWDYVTTNLYSEYAYFDKTNQAGVVPTGNRAVIYPSISVPFTQPYGFITPKIGLHNTTYDLKNNTSTINGITLTKNSASRTLPIFSVDSGLYFDRDFNVVKNHYTQTIEPRLFYVYIPNNNQDALPVFDTALSDLNSTTLFSENQFTGSDRINNANQMSLAVTSRIINSNTGEERLAATLGQRYYFAKQNVTLPGGTKTDSNSSDIIANLTAYLSNKWKLDTNWQYSTDSSRWVRSNISARYNPEPGKLLNFGYQYSRALLQQFDINAQWPIGRGWYGVGRYNYSLKDKRLIEGLAGAEYDAGCWQTRAVVQRVETVAGTANYGIYFQLELGGLASIGSNPLNLLRREVPGYQSSNEIPDIYRQQNYNR